MSEFYSTSFQIELYVADCIAQTFRNTSKHNVDIILFRKPLLSWNYASYKILSSNWDIPCEEVLIIVFSTLNDSVFKNSPAYTVFLLTLDLTFASFFNA